MLQLHRLFPLSKRSTWNMTNYLNIETGNFRFGTDVEPAGSTRKGNDLLLRFMMGAKAARVTVQLPPDRLKCNEPPKSLINKKFRFHVAGEMRSAPDMAWNNEDKKGLKKRPPKLAWEPAKCSNKTVLGKSLEAPLHPPSIKTRKFT